MTVTSFCPECREVCFDHATICTTCGTELINNTTTTSSSSSSLSFSLFSSATSGSESELPPPPRIRAIDWINLPLQVQDSDVTTLSSLVEHLIGNDTSSDTNNNNNNNNNGNNNDTTNTSTTDGTGTGSGSRRGTIRLSRTTTTNEIGLASTEIRELLRSIQERIASVNAEQQELLHALLTTQVFDGRQQQQQQEQNTNTGTPTEQSYLLNTIPRTVLQYDSNLFQTASFTILTLDNNIPTNTSTTTTGTTTGTGTNIPVVVAEFGSEYCERMYQSYSEKQSTLPSNILSSQQRQEIIYNDAYLVIADPFTGVGGKLRQCCLDEIEAIQQYHHLQISNSTTSTTDTMTTPNIILCFKRGDNVTFVQKALMGQQLATTPTGSGKINVVACVIGNNVVNPWPYVMKDSKNESSSSQHLHDKLSIPVIMTSLHDCQKLLQHAVTCKKQNKYMKCSLTIHRHVPSSSSSFSIAEQYSSSTTTTTTTTRECIICTEFYQPGHTIVTLPCKHVFHEECAMQWLTKHNTCPYCRYTLPTTKDEASRPAQVVNSNGNTNTNNSSTMFG